MAGARGLEPESLDEPEVEGVDADSGITAMQAR